MTNTEIDAGAKALEAYAEGQSWKARFAPASAWHEGSIAIIKAADAASFQTPSGRQEAAVDGLHKALKAVGYENELTAQQYHDAGAVVLAAVHRLRPAIRNMSQDGPKPNG